MIHDKTFIVRLLKQFYDFFHFNGYMTGLEALENRCNLYGNSSDCNRLNDTRSTRCMRALREVLTHCH